MSKTDSAFTFLRTRITNSLLPIQNTTGQRPNGAFALLHTGDNPLHPYSLFGCTHRSIAWKKVSLEYLAWPSA